MQGLSPYQIKLDTFEGPMDLLVHLVRKNDVDIYDIPISFITRQFHGYIQALQSLNIEFAGEFLVMAATLSHIKSKMLLPVYGQDDEEDPRMEIARPLLEYLQLKAAAEALDKQTMLGRDTFLKGWEEPVPDIEDTGSLEVSVYDLAVALSRLLDGKYSAHKVVMDIEHISIKDRMTEIITLLEKKISATLAEIVGHHRAKNNIIATFLAILELGKLNLTAVNQAIQNGEITVTYIG